MFNPIIKTVRALREKGVSGMVKQLYQIGDLKFGVYKGSDAMGNKYYEDLDQPFGQHRWVEYKDLHNFDASMVQPDWHGWLHHMRDEVPGQKPAEGTEKTIIPTHSAPTSALSGINTHVYESNVEPTEMMNQTQLRQRGYRVGSLKTGPDDEDKYYKQKGHPLHKDAFTGMPGTRYTSLKNSHVPEKSESKYAPMRPGEESDTPEVKEFERIQAMKQAL